MPRTVLVVDDSRATRRIMRSILESLELAVVEAEHGQAALEYCLNEGAPDAILLDLDMPVMDGMTMLRALRQHAGMAPVRVLVCTADREEEREREALDAGADAYVTKPFNSAIIESKLRELQIL